MLLHIKLYICMKVLTYVYYIFFPPLYKKWEIYFNDLQSEKEKFYVIHFPFQTTNRQQHSNHPTNLHPMLLVETTRGTLTARECNKRVTPTLPKSQWTALCTLCFFFFPFFIRYLAHLHFQCYTKSPPYPPTPTPLPTHSPFLALAFPCTGAYKVCVSNGPLFPVMAD